MERLRKGISIFAAAALLAPAGGALAGRPAFHHHRADHEGEEADHPSDRGAKPAKSTAGDLTLRSRFLLGKDGNTQFEISTAPFDVGATPVGNISHVELRAIDPSGAAGDDDDKGDSDEKRSDEKRSDEKRGKEFRFHKEFEHLRDGGYFTRTFPGLPHGLNIRVEAKARGVPRRDELEAKWVDVVHYRPDLVVTQIDAPSSAFVKSTVSVTALVVEHMGDLGAHADCVLLVDGVQADIAPDMWIDASGSTTCRFVATFTVAGMHKLTVSAQNVRPGDYDNSNNSLSRTINIINPIIPVYDASASETTTVSSNTLDVYNVSTETTPDSHQVTTMTSVSQSRSFVGTIPSALSLSQPWKVSYSDQSGGRILSSMEYPSVTLDANGNYFDVEAATGRQLAIMRSFDAATNTGSTHVGILLPSSETTTFSQKTCSQTAVNCTAGDYTVNPTAAVNVPLADDYSADVVVDDGVPYSAHAAFALTPFGSTTPATTSVCVLFRAANLKIGKRCLSTSTATWGKSGGVSVTAAQASQ
jgi:hypothetical protein